MAENLERSIFMKADDLPDYFDNIQRYVRGFKSRIAVKKNEGKDSEAGPSTKIEANDRWRIICANVYDELLELKMKNMILSIMVTRILQSDERPVKELIQGQINRLKGMLGLDRVLRFHYLELLSLPNDQMGTVHQCPLCTWYVDRTPVREFRKNKPNALFGFDILVNEKSQCDIDNSKLGSTRLSILLHASRNETI